MMHPLSLLFTLVEVCAFFQHVFHACLLVGLLVLLQVRVNIDDDHGLPGDVQQEVLDIWDARWEMLDTPMLGAGYCLDPEFLSDDGLSINNKEDSSVKQLRLIINRLLPTKEEQKAARLSYMAFRDREGEFGGQDAIDDADSTPAHQWWDMYGAGHPELQKVAKRVLSQPTSACSCERNWSSYDFIHNSRRNRLTAERARDLVHVFTNGRLVEKMNKTAGAQFIGWDEEEEMVEDLAEEEEVMSHD
jgi:hypothetical protein